MSSIPGYSLESYIGWHFNLVAEDLPEVNWSLKFAETFGTIPSRRRMTKDEFAKVVAPFEPYRDSVERWLMDFDDENQSWRDYAGTPPVPDEVFEGLVAQRTR